MSPPLLLCCVALCCVVGYIAQVYQAVTSLERLEKFYAMPEKDGMGGAEGDRDGDEDGAAWTGARADGRWDILPSAGDTLYVTHTHPPNH